MIAVLVNISWAVAN